MTKEIYLSEAEYKALETQITNHAMDVRDKLIKEQGESIRELASALKEAVDLTGSAPCYEDYRIEFRRLANKYLGNTQPIKEE